MLIASPRHRPEDLALWREHEAADLLHHVPAERVRRSVDEMNRFAQQPCYISCSWGKDSVVLLDILARSARPLPVVWVRMRGRDNPDCLAVRDAALARWRLDYHERSFRYEECGRDQHWRAVAGEFGARRITGIRMDESGRRTLSVRHLGLSTDRSCRPLAYWRVEDVFAWLAQEGLPVHPAYAMLGGGRWPREHLRTHGIGGESGSNYGRSEWEREYYGDVLRFISATSL